MEDEDIAAAMGFSSFGSAKKRKFDQTNSPKARAAGVSGANSTKLGVRPKTAAEVQGQKVQATIDTVVSSTDAEDAAQSHSHPTTTKVEGKQKQPAATNLADFLARGQTLPDKSSHTQSLANPPIQDDPSATYTVSFGGPCITQAELNALRSGVKDENGDTAYFLPSFVEDPWERFGNLK